MALRDQPYIPLYVQDFLTDEKLIECSAESTGVYIRLMCLMHKNEEYGKILLKQKDKQTDNQIENFALKLLKYLPYSLNTISGALSELIREGVLLLSDDSLCQKRMIKDNELSIKRSESGKKGGNPSLKIKGNRITKSNKLAYPKSQANTENENENENESNIIKKGVQISKLKDEYIFEEFRILYKGTKRGLDKEFADFKRKHKDYKTVLPLLKPAIIKLITWREKKAATGFVPEIPHLSTWINNRRWEDELPEIDESQTNKPIENEQKVWGI